MFDPNRVAQVVTNLLSNAIKFSPQDGRIEIRAERWEAWCASAYATRARHQQRRLPKLFKKFSQIDPARPAKSEGPVSACDLQGHRRAARWQIWVESVPTREARSIHPSAGRFVEATSAAA